MSVNFNHKEKTLSVNQHISFVNNTSKKLDTLYLSDWSNSYSSIKTPLAQRFGEEYDRSFFLSKKSKLGNTKINYIRGQDKAKKDLGWRPKVNLSKLIKIMINEEIKYYKKL